MEWSKLYTDKRLGSRNLQVSNELRGQYLRDYDKVIFSSNFRRLQSKTQVFPLPGSIFVHNRLTHSLEVASVGRSLGRAVGEALAEKHKDSFDSATYSFYKYELSDVIQTACLSHDIGNPPYGHFGEVAIRDFFVNFFKDKNYGLSEIELADLKNFEGNANAFRILTTIFQENGLKLTYPTLASIIKYPSNSLGGFNKKSGFLHTKKSGYFSQEQSYFNEVLQVLEISNIPQASHIPARHPFVYLVEAADDICYRIIDLEDALRLGIITLEQSYDLLLPFFEEDTNKAYIEEQIKLVQNPQQIIALLRAMLINQLTLKCHKAFIKYEAELLAGSLNASLIDLLDDKTVKLLKKIDKFSFEKIYNHHSVVEKELAGYHVITGLLEEYIGAIVNADSIKSQKVLHLLPSFSKAMFDTPFYNQILQVVDFISDMSDEQALDLFRKLRGI